MSRSLSVHLILICAQIAFASLAVAGRMAMAQGPLAPALAPDLLVLARLAGGAAVFWLCALATGPVRLRWRELPLLAVCAALGMAINQELFLHGLARTTATNAVVLVTTVPVFTSLFALLLGREPLRPLRLAGIAVALTGALVLVGVEELSLGSEHTVGNLMVLANTAAYGLFLVLVRPLHTHHRPMELVALLFTLALIMTAPLGIPAWLESPPLSGRDLGFLAFLVAVPTVGAYGLTQLALERAEASLVASYVYLQPLFAAAGAALLLDERPGPRTGVAALLIFAGVWLSSRAQRTARRDHGASSTE